MGFLFVEDSLCNNSTEIVPKIIVKTVVIENHHMT